MPPVHDNIDAVILSHASKQWQKVAMILAKALRTFENATVEISDEVIAARIETMVKDGRLEANGNLSKWRHSEVRLPTKIG